MAEKGTWLTAVRRRYLRTCQVYVRIEGEVPEPEERDPENEVTSRQP